MNPTATVRLRRATAAIALLWALVAFGLSVGVRLQAERQLGPPFLLDGLATDPWQISAMAPAAAAAGLEAGDRLLAIDGHEVGPVVLRWRDLFRAGTPNVYRVEKQDGRVAQYALDPCLPAELLTPLMWVLVIALPIVGLVYLGVGFWVWRLRPNRASTWSFFLFCCVMAAQLSLPPVPGRWVWPMLWINVPLIGAATFHLFTTYPTEPAWIVRNRTLRWLPYAIAFPLGLAGAFEGVAGMHAPVAKTASFWFTITLALVSLGVAAHNRSRRARIQDGRARRRDAARRRRFVRSGADRGVVARIARDELPVADRLLLVLRVPARRRLRDRAAAALRDPRGGEVVGDLRRRRHSSSPRSTRS